MDEQAEKQLVQLASMLAEAVIYQEVKTSPDVILHTLKQSIDSLNAEQEKVRIHLNPEDLELIKESYGEQTIIDNNWQLNLHRWPVQFQSHQTQQVQGQCRQH